jgi:hypothetical protein
MSSLIVEKLVFRVMPSLQFLLSITLSKGSCNGTKCEKKKKPPAWELSLSLLQLELVPY